MSIQIIINNTPIDFPSSAQSPNWAPALVEFAQSVETALTGIVGPYDVPAQVLNIENDGAEHIIQTPSVSLVFSTTQVRGFTVRYSVYRSNTSTPTAYNHAETGTLLGVFNSSLGTWELQREFIGNITPQGTSGSGLTTSGINFRIDNNGQLYYTASVINPLGYSGKLAFAAQALLQNS